jgi:hypothetical protein
MQVEVRSLFFELDIKTFTTISSIFTTIKMLRWTVLLVAIVGGINFSFTFCNIVSHSSNLALAFVTPVRQSSTGLKMSFSQELGAQAPLGFWDPLGLLKKADQARFERLRTVSLCPFFQYSYLLL